MFRIKDEQNAGFFEGQEFANQKDVRQALINLHSNDSPEDVELEKMTLEDLCSYGSWKVVLSSCECGSKEFYVREDYAYKAELDKEGELDCGKADGGISEICCAKCR